MYCTYLLYYHHHTGNGRTGVYLCVWACAMQKSRHPQTNRRWRRRWRTPVSLPLPLPSFFQLRAIYSHHHQCTFPRWVSSALYNPLSPALSSPRGVLGDGLGVCMDHLEYRAGREWWEGNRHTGGVSAHTARSRGVVCHDGLRG